MSINVHIDNLNIYYPLPESCTTCTCDVDTSTLEPAVSVKEPAEPASDSYCTKCLKAGDILRVWLSSDPGSKFIAQFVTFADPLQVSIVANTAHPDYAIPVNMVFYNWERA